MVSVMTFVQTGRSIPESDKIYWRLSAYLARKLYPPLKFYGNAESAHKFVHDWGIVFDEIDTHTIAREASGAHEMCWSAGKLAAMKSMSAAGQPFFHIDGDAFIFHALGDRFESARMFGQCVEKNITLRTALFRRNTNYPIRELLPDLRLPAWMQKYSRLPKQSVVNMGIFGGTDLNAIGEYAEAALRAFVRDKHNNAVFKAFYRSRKHWLAIAGLAEQWVLAAYCWYRKIEPVVIMERNDAYNLNRSHELPGHYCHLYTPCRKQPEFQQWAQRKWNDLVNQPELIAA